VDRHAADSLFKLLAERWEKAIRDKNYKQATDLAMAAELAFRGDPVLGNIGLVWLTVIHKQTAGEAEEPTDMTCSFCAQETKPKELIEGVSAKICRTCVQNMARQLADK
jgi:hypothetical protein